MSDALPPVVDGLDVLLLAVVGSTAYGLAHEESDRDFLGVFRAPTHQVLGLDSQAVERTVTSTDPDAAMHEVGKFMRLVLSGNPTVTELLWVPEFLVASPLGLELVAAREAFLSAPAVRSAYGGYALSQAHRLASGRGPDHRVEKLGRHSARLLLQGRELLETGALTLDVSHVRDDLFERGRQACMDPASYLEFITGEVEALDAIESVLPEVPDRERVDQLLRSVRLAGLGLTLRSPVPVRGR